VMGLEKRRIKKIEGKPKEIDEEASLPASN
jgi:hypothetical protein